MLATDLRQGEATDPGLRHTASPPEVPLPANKGQVFPQGRQPVASDPKGPEKQFPPHPVFPCLLPGNLGRAFREDTVTGATQDNRGV